ncbi:MAG: HD domain-containing protein [Atopobium sp.]
MKDGRSFEELAEPVAATAAFHQMDAFIQHGDTTCSEHCLSVASIAFRIAHALPFSFHMEDLVTGALLHDYFLYDWHESATAPDRWHGFTHPFHALHNAERDFDLTPIERDVIVHHMFPFVPIPPRTREGWVVTFSDKASCVAEVLAKKTQSLERSTHCL